MAMRGSNEGGGGGGGNDGLTRDFLRLRTISHRGFPNMAGLDHMNSPSSSYDQQNQNQTPWQEREFETGGGIEDSNPEIDLSIWNKTFTPMKKVRIFCGSDQKSIGLHFSPIMIVLLHTASSSTSSSFSSFSSFWTFLQEIILTIKLLCNLETGFLLPNPAVLSSFRLCEPHRNVTMENIEKAPISIKRQVNDMDKSGSFCMERLGTGLAIMLMPMPMRERDGKQETKRRDEKEAILDNNPSIMEGRIVILFLSQYHIVI
ncbi:unnamed protein product [Camellia sinensis]